MITKRYIKTRKTTKVTFKVDFAKTARKVEILGDFNGWASEAMQRTKKGEFRHIVELAPGQHYQFRYRIDGVWENDWAADAYLPNGLGEDNSVVIC